MFIIFFSRFTLRGGCTIIVEILKCLRGEYLFLFLLPIAMPQFRCPVPSILAFTFTTCCLSRARLHGLLHDGVMIQGILL